MSLGATAQSAIARSLERILSSGVLRVRTCADQPPMASRNDKAEYQGFDIEVANSLAGSCGWPRSAAGLKPPHG